MYLAQAYGLGSKATIVDDVTSAHAMHSIHKVYKSQGTVYIFYAQLNWLATLHKTTMSGMTLRFSGFLIGPVCW